MINDHKLKRYQYKIGKTEKLLYLFCFISLIIIYTTNLDFIISDFIYDKTKWSFQQSFWAETIMHKTTKIILIIVYMYLVFKLFKLIKNKNKSNKIYDLFILLITLIISVLIVSLSKKLFNVDCPWDLIRYGGDKQFFSIFNYPEQLKPSSHCFPASHASVGFTWIAVIFYFKVRKVDHKNKFLFIVLLLGLSFGMAQQIRGAHFISHDIWSLILCLSTSVFIYSIAYKGERPNEKI